MITLKFFLVGFLIIIFVKHYLVFLSMSHILNSLNDLEDQQLKVTQKFDGCLYMTL